ncbi:cadherin repeat domain-containing protein [Stratiformator vulcanicus]|uniref:Uncharacterized protein n=1 Tax=Stratiformator vulcanicus TaxID=2527980 RepID=A0A517QW86_9PLAN|nr:cadherin repeat domain-containing protein [Stratiformator vulcanicus]QDT35833.1 hypothetical protein Pan189_01860 [Stratiformator vulcanicus]
MVVTDWLRSLYVDSANSFRPRRRRRGFTAIEPLEQRVMLSGTATNPQTIDIDWHQTQKRISTGWRDSLLLDELNDPSAQITGHSNFTPANGVDGGQLRWVSKWGGIDWIAPKNFSTNADDELVASFDITVDNGTDTYDATVNIKLKNSAVTAADDAFVINNEDDIYTGWRGPLFDNDNDSDGDDLTTTTQRDVSTDGGVAKWLSKRGGLFYKPDADYLGVDELSYTVTDGVSSDSAGVKIAVVGDINITLSEDTAVGTYVATLPAEWASDPFSVSLSNSEYFEIEEIDGEHKLTLIKQLDYESTGYIDGKSWKGVGFTEAFEVTATQGGAAGFDAASGRVVVSVADMTGIDLGADIDGDGDIDEDDDAAEDPSNGLGLRTFVNVDDDNLNGVADSSDSSATYTSFGTFIDDDLLEVSLDLSEVHVAANAGKWIALEATQLRLYSNQQKSSLTGYDPTVTQGSRRYWKIGADGQSSLPSTVYVEGYGEGDFKVHLRLYSEDRATIIERDTISVSVEALKIAVDPATDLSLDTSHWDNTVDVPTGWKVIGSLATIAGGTPAQLRTPGPVKNESTGQWLGKNLGSTYDVTFDIDQAGSYAYEISFEYSFENGRPGITTGHYVEADNADSKPGFFANGGVYFDNKAELQIYDTAALLAAINGTPVVIGGNQVTLNGGLNGSVTNLSGGSKPWRQESVNTLISGVPYASDSSLNSMTDLETAPQGGGQIAIQFRRIEADGVDSIYEIRTLVGDGDWGEWTRIDGGTSGSSKRRVPNGKIHFQQHWGSGVIYSNINIKEI